MPHNKLFQHDYIFEYAIPSHVSTYPNTWYMDYDLRSYGASIEYLCDSGISLLDIIRRPDIKLDLAKNVASSCEFSLVTFRILEIYSQIVSWLLVSRYRVDIDLIGQNLFWNTYTFGYTNALLNSRLGD